MKTLIFLAIIFVAACSKTPQENYGKEIAELRNSIEVIKKQNTELSAFLNRRELLDEKLVIPSPTLRPFADNREWMLAENLSYVIGNTGVSITIPKGFVTDFASIPEALWSFGLSPHGRYSKAAIVHDYLYWAQTCTKEQADNILLIAMKESDVGIVKEGEIYQGVNIGGGKSWKENSIARKNRIPRIIPEDYQDIPAQLTWQEYRKFLISKSVRDPEFTSGSAYCKYGNSKTVPGRG